MSCADVEPRLGELLAGALSALEEEIVVAHLVECAHAKMRALISRNEWQMQV